MNIFFLAANEYYIKNSTKHKTCYVSCNSTIDTRKGSTEPQEHKITASYENVFHHILQIK
jgi:hypothetical protein